MKISKSKINLDIFRIFLAILVMSIHSIVESDGLSFYIKQGIARWAVPLFFMLIGMNLSVEKLTQKGFIRKYVKSQCNIFLPWICLITAMAFIDIINSNTAKYVGVLYGQFWFVIAACFSMLYLLLLLRCLSIKSVFIISCLLHLFGIAGDSYFCFTKSIPLVNSFFSSFLSVFATSRWGFSFGLFYICLGMLLSGKNLGRIRPGVKLLLFVLSCVVQAVEITALRRAGAYDYNMYFSLIPISILIFDFLKNHASHGPSIVNYKRISVYVYITHSIVIYIVSSILDVYNIRSVFVEVFIIYLILAMLIIPISIALKKRFGNRAVSLRFSNVKAILSAICFISGPICVVLGIFVRTYPEYVPKNIISVGLALICFGIALRSKAEERYKKSIVFLCSLLLCISFFFFRDFLRLKYFSIRPVYTVDVFVTENTTYYSTLLYEAYISNKYDLPVSFEKREAMDYEKIDNYFID